MLLLINRRGDSVPINFPKIKFKESGVDVCGNHVIISRFFSQKETSEQMFSKGKHTNGKPENYSFYLFNFWFLLFLLFFDVIARY